VLAVLVCGVIVLGLSFFVDGGTLLWLGLLVGIGAGVVIAATSGRGGDGDDAR
jgi:hypothetical protein